MILAVDDDPLILMGTAALLRSLDLDVVTASDATEALAVLNGAESIDILLTDVEMPKRNGIELAKAAVKLLPGLKVVLATGRSPVVGSYPSKWRILPKPFSREELLAILGSVDKRSVVRRT